MLIFETVLHFFMLLSVHRLNNMPSCYVRTTRQTGVKRFFFGGRGLKNGAGILLPLNEAPHNISHTRLTIFPNGDYPDGSISFLPLSYFYGR